MERRWKSDAVLRSSYIFIRDLHTKYIKEHTLSTGLEFERRQQKAITDSGFTSVQYYATDDPHITKMDFINGMTLADRMQNLKI